MHISIQKNMPVYYMVVVAKFIEKFLLNWSGIGIVLNYSVKGQNCYGIVFDNSKLMKIALELYCSNEIDKKLYSILFMIKSLFWSTLVSAPHN